MHHLIAFCLNDACRHQAIIDVSKYPAETPVPWFRLRVKYGKCGGKRVDVRPNWNEKPGMPDNWEARPAWDECWRPATAWRQAMPRTFLRKQAA
jgi:hypothetical protein